MMSPEIIEELRIIRDKLEHIEILLEERLIGLEESLEDEDNAIKRYEKIKSKGKLKLISIEDIVKDG
ncbi:MAG: hypothetical protein J7K23_01775 [Thermoproteales archaeon]|nr:hypothetical protein [Thermoproteales archaeon]